MTLLKIWPEATAQLQERLLLSLVTSSFYMEALATESYGIVPGKEGRCSSVKDWVDQLNAWKDQQLQDLLQKPSLLQGLE